MIYNITPVPAPRQTRRDRWNPSPAVERYHAFRDEVRLKIKTMPDRYWVIFWMPMPRSWSKAKKDRMCRQPHRQTPDKDNLEKALLDAVYPEGDSHKWDGRATKVWSFSGYIEIQDMGDDWK